MVIGMRILHDVSRPLTLAVLTASLVAFGCNKSVSTSKSLPAANPTSTDPGAGNWRMIVLSGPSQIAVAPPSPVSSEAYQAELAAVRSAQATITESQRQAIDYWSAGGVLRWNQIMLELVARYNLPPAPRENGSYVFPDSENPFADPQFPFANPPYSARAMSYVSVAQFEALKAAWYYKYQFNRPLPSKVDPAVSALVPTSDLPAYPSEDAVLSGVSADMLKLMFPAAVEEITLKAGEQRTAALLSGKATASDIAAGLALGKAVAAVVVVRAGADGMRNAIGTPAQWDAMSKSATARGEVPWVSLEQPPRPPMLPNFGQVRSWMMTSTDVVNERPAPPPSTSSAQMHQELAEVKDTTENLTRDQLAIALEWNDGASTYTPPGHWNFIAEDYVGNGHFSEVRAARAFALLNMALHDAAVGCWEAKYTYFNPRPSQLDPTIKTVLGMPNFPSYVSGHSTFSSAAARVLSHLFTDAKPRFEAMRDEASISRLYGGIHYRSDIDAGKGLGDRIAGYTLRFAAEDGAE
jgi:hypothetical protein